jgi:hypothetical protein
LSQLQAEGECGDAGAIPVAPDVTDAAALGATDDGPDAALGATDDGPDAALGAMDDAGNVAAGCGSPVVVHIGGSLSGSTCGGPQLTDENLCQSSGHPVYYFTVDAPSGAAFSINSTAPVAIQAFETCGGSSPNCSFNSMQFTLAPNDSGLRLFAVQRFDITCGDFSIAVGGQ